jgi:DNA-binding CsgD family transcriptional regulator
VIGRQNGELVAEGENERDTRRLMRPVDEAYGEPSNDDPASTGAGPAQLTSREIDVAELIKQGLSSKEAAEKLGISERAVVFHRQSLRRKLGVTGSSEGLRNALRRLSGIAFDK